MFFLVERGERCQCLDFLGSGFSGMGLEALEYLVVFPTEVISLFLGKQVHCPYRGSSGITPTFQYIQVHVFSGGETR